MCLLVCNRKFKFLACGFNKSIVCSLYISKYEAFTVYCVCVRVLGVCVCVVGVCVSVCICWNR